MRSRLAQCCAALFSMGHGMGKHSFVAPDCKMNSMHYQTMVSDDYAPQIGAWYGGEQAVFIQDGAPSHTSRSTRAHMEELWADTQVLFMDQPPSSPDLNVLDWSIWSQIQGLMPERFASVLDVKIAVLQATEEVRATLDMHAIRFEFVRRLVACVASNGNHFEHLGRDYAREETTRLLGNAGMLDRE